jgi:hypothetical protein
MRAPRVADSDQILVMASGPGQRLEVGGRDKGPDAEKSAKVAEYLRVAFARFKQIAEAENQLRIDMLEDKRFLASEQWPQQIKAAREADGRPCLTINRLPMFVRQVMNQVRQSRPAIQINPVDGGADPKTAEALQGLVRNIENNSDADVAYLTAAEEAIALGRGYWRILTEYATDDGFEQEIRIAPIPDQFLVYLDHPVDGSEPEFGFIVSDLTPEQFRAKFPHADQASLTQFQTIGDAPQDWMSAGRVRVAEYFHVVTSTSMLYAIQFPGDAQTPPKVVNLAANTPGLKEMIAAGKVKKLDERELTRRQVKWSTISAAEILDGSDDRTDGRDWPGRFIPIVSVLGVETLIDGKRDLRGMVRDAKDPGRMYNFWVSAQTEAVALAPRAPYLVADGQLEGYESMWKDANRRNYAYLPYKPKSVGDQLVPAPQRNVYEPPVRAIADATMQADRDLKAVLGMFDASQEKSAEQSGKAIIARQQQGETGNSHFLDNLARGIRRTGKILLDLIPRIYDLPRVIRINGSDDDQEKVLLLHSGRPNMADQMKQALQMASLAGVFDVSVGRYDVTVTVGPSYASRRQEAVEAMVQFVQAFPAVFPAIGDVLAGSMDWPGAQEVAKRLKRLVPPQALSDDDDAQQIPPEAQAAMQAAQQQVQQLTELLQSAQQQIATDAAKANANLEIKRLEIASRERIASLQAEAELAKTAATLGQQRDLAILEAQLATVREQQANISASRQAAEQRAHDVGMTGLEQDHQASMADRSAAHQAAATDQNAAIAAQQAERDQATAENAPAE